MLRVGTARGGNPRTERSSAVRRAGWRGMRVQGPTYLKVNTEYSDPPLLFPGQMHLNLFLLKLTPVEP